MWDEGFTKRAREHVNTDQSRVKWEAVGQSVRLSSKTGLYSLTSMNEKGVL